MGLKKWPLLVQKVENELNNFNQLKGIDMSINQIEKLESQVWNSDVKGFYDKNFTFINITNANMFTEDFNPLRVHQTASGYYIFRGILKFSGPVGTGQQETVIGTITFPNDGTVHQNIATNIAFDGADNTGNSDFTIGISAKGDNILRLISFGQTLTTDHLIHVNLQAYDVDA